MTLRAYRGQAPFREANLCQTIVQVLVEERQRQQCAIYVYCLMPDHLHMLLSPRREGLSVLTFVEQFKGKSTNKSWAVGWVGRLWQPRFYDHIVGHEESVKSIAEYVLGNPVRKGLVHEIDEWPWSGQPDSYW